MTVTLVSFPASGGKSRIGACVGRPYMAEGMLSRLIEKAARGESFVIAKVDEPTVRVRALDMPANGQRQRIGFLKGRSEVPDDFDPMGRALNRAGFVRDSIF